MKSGLIIPSPASCANSAKMPSPITTIPADLKNSGACFEWANDADPKERSRSIGSVPSAKKSMISSPDINDPLESAATCIDCVKPQGRKNVPIPSRSGANVWCYTFLKKLNIPEGRVNLLFLKIPVRLSPSTIIMVAASNPSTAEKM